MASLPTHTESFLFFLAAPSTDICGYSNSKIEILGSLKLTVCYWKRTLPSFVFNVARKGANVMGLNLFTALGLAWGDMWGGGR